MQDKNKFLKDRFSFDDNTPELQNAKRRTEKIDGKKVNGDLDTIITNYLNRFSDIIDLDENNTKQKNKKENSIKAFKKMIFNANIIKKENIPERYWELQKQIIKDRGELGDLPNGEITEKIKKQEFEKIVSDQKKSLEIWIDYFVDITANYPIEFKYWALRNIVKLQSFDKEKNKFPKRNKNTVANFPELNREAIAWVFDTIEKKILQKNISKPHEGVKDEEFERIIKTQNFGNLYSFSIKEVTASRGEILKNIRGEWKKYDMGSDHKILVNSIQGKGTGWCTAGESTAKSQLENGNFYVYYSEDNYRKNTIPRIAIRMEWNKIAEIRGIDEYQNFDPYIGPILDKKIEEFGNEGKKYMKKSDDMKELTLLYNAFQNDNAIEIDKEQLTKLYGVAGKKYEGFGYLDDLRIEEILKTRDRKKNLAYIFNCNPEEISSNKQDILDGKEIVFFDGDLDLNSLEKLPEGFSFPENIGGDLHLDNLKELPDGFSFPKNIGGSLNLNSLKEIPEGFSFPENIGLHLHLDSLEKIPDLISFPKSIGLSLYLNSLKEIPKGVSFPENIGFGLNLDSLEKLPDGFSFPESIGWGLILNSLEKLPNGVSFPKSIGLSLCLNSLKEIPEGVSFPENIGWDLILNSLEKLPDGFNFPKNILGKLYLNSLDENQKQELKRKRPDLNII